MNEKQLTKAVIELLRACGWYVIRTHMPGQYAPTPGVSDLIAISPAGRTACIELKGPKAKTSMLQMIFIDEMKSRNTTAFIATDVETVVEELGLQVLL